MSHESNESTWLHESDESCVIPESGVKKTILYT